MTEPIDWQPGDIALCIRDRAYCGTRLSELTKGRFYTVSVVGKGVEPKTLRMVLALLLVEVSPPRPGTGYDASWFTKFDPGEESAERRAKEPVTV